MLNVVFVRTGIQDLSLEHAEMKTAGLEVSALDWSYLMVKVDVWLKINLWLIVVVCCFHELSRLQVEHSVHCG